MTQAVRMKAHKLYDSASEFSIGEIFQIMDDERRLK